MTQPIGVWIEPNTTGRCPHGLPLFNCAICATPMPPQPMGCICPPGANIECKNPLCPRRGYQRHDPIRP